MGRLWPRAPHWWTQMTRHFITCCHAQFSASISGTRASSLLHTRPQELPAVYSGIDMQSIDTLTMKIKQKIVQISQNEQARDLTALFLPFISVPLTS